MITRRMKCELCSQTWTAHFPEKCTNLECPYCSYMTPVEIPLTCEKCNYEFPPVVLVEGETIPEEIVCPICGCITDDFHYTLKDDDNQEE